MCDFALFFFLSPRPGASELVLKKNRNQDLLVINILLI